MTDLTGSKLLLVEDNRVMASLVAVKLRRRATLDIHTACDFAQAKALLAGGGDEFFLAVLDLNLPDAPNGEIVDLVRSAGVSAIVFTGESDLGLREQILGKRVIDYVFKDTSADVDYLVSQVLRIHANRDIGVLVAGPPESMAEVSDYLRESKFQVFEATSAAEAEEALARSEEIRMLVVDHDLPDASGPDFVRRIRQDFSKDKLAIIGLSGGDQPALSARFIKRGANDFLNRPFLPEEFLLRVFQNAEMIEFIDSLKADINLDFLTGLYNRRYLFLSGTRLVSSAQRGQISIIVAMVDVDHFKRINDTWGHDGGDRVLMEVADMLRLRTRKSDLVARFGGEEFCMLLINMEPDHTEDYFEDLRKRIEQHPFDTGKAAIPVTVSMGVCTRLGASLEEMITAADKNLYAAKQGGRNRVVIDG